VEVGRRAPRPDAPELTGGDTRHHRAISVGPALTGKSAPMRPDSV
jgi:hypothetical protein